MDAPVFITDRRKPSLVVLTMKEYERITGKERSILAALTPNNPVDHDQNPPPTNPFRACSGDGVDTPRRHLCAIVEVLPHH
jgi:hypothetical protein